LLEHGAWRKGMTAMGTTDLTAANAQTLHLPSETTAARLIAQHAHQLLDQPHRRRLLGPSDCAI
jgi:hypothetical protein